MKTEYSDWMFNKDYAAPGELETQIKKLAIKQVEDAAQYDLIPNLPLYQPQNLKVDVRTGEYAKCPQTSSLDYFPHIFPKAVVKQDFLYNVHIINSRNNGSVILGWVDPTIEREEINVGSYSFSIGSGTTKFVNKHEYRHLKGVLNEDANRTADSAENPELARNGGIDPLYMK